MNWLPLNQAVRIVFRELDAKPPHQQTAIRWARKGKLGIRLQTRRFNGQYQTTVDHVREFLAAIEKASEPRDVQRDRRRKQLDRVSSELDELLGNVG